MKFTILILVTLASVNTFAIEVRNRKVVSPGGKPNASATQSSSQSGQNYWEFGIGISYSLSYGLGFDSATVTTIAGKSTHEYSNAVALDLEVRNLPYNAFGFIGGVSYDLDHEFKSEKLDTSTGPATVNYTGGSIPKIQATTILVNVAYAWDRLYLPVGVNYAFFRYSPRTDTGTYEMSGGIGGQIGLGYYVTDMVSVDASYRKTAITHRVENAGVGIQDYGSGFITSSVVSAKYLF